MPRFLKKEAEEVKKVAEEQAVPLPSRPFKLTKSSLLPSQDILLLQL